MKLVIDNALAPRIAQRLRQAGYDVIHVRERNMQTATDEQILVLAAQEERVVVSADTDFGTLLALRSQRFPSFLMKPALIAGRRARRSSMLTERSGPGKLNTTKSYRQVS